MENETICQNYLVETIKRIDKMQKEIVFEEKKCIDCNHSLMLNAYNTIPVSFAMCGCNKVIAKMGVKGKNTEFFRIESLRDNRYVSLRLLELSDSLTATEYIFHLDLECVCSIQCFEPINIDTCDI